MLDYFPVRPDVLVFALGLLLYLTDLGRLIYANEILLCGAGSSHWSAKTPDNGFLFSRRFAVFPRPLDPGSVVIALTWPTERDAAQGAAQRKRLAAIKPDVAYPRLACRLLLPQIFLGLPGAYLMPRHDIPVLLMLLVIYLQIVALTAWLFRVRRRLALPTRMCLLWAFESIVCIPYAVNVHRKVAAYLLNQARQDVIETAAALLPAREWERLFAYLQSAIHEQRSAEGADMARAEALRNFQLRLQEAHTREHP